MNSIATHDVATRQGRHAASAAPPHVANVGGPADAPLGLLVAASKAHQSAERRALAASQKNCGHTALAGQRARKLALHQCLTSSPNRPEFRWQLERALEQAVQARQTLAVIHLHLDGFKPINDAYGDDASDALLKAVANRISQSLRDDDTVGRIGADVFACALANVQSRGRLNYIARKLFDAVAAPMMIGTLRVSVVPSLGVARFPVDGATVDVLLGKADAAMREAARQMSGCVFFRKHRDELSRTASQAVPSLRTNHASRAVTAQHVLAT